MDSFEDCTVRNWLGITSLLLFPIVSYLITTRYQSEAYCILIGMCGVVHFTPIFLREPSKRSRYEWAMIWASINLGIYAIASKKAIFFFNLGLLTYFSALKKHPKYVYTL